MKPKKVTFEEDEDHVQRGCFQSRRVRVNLMSTSNLQLQEPQFSALSTSGSANMAQTILQPFNAAEGFNFPDFIQDRFRVSNIVDPTEEPANEQDR